MDNPLPRPTGTPPLDATAAESLKGRVAQLDIGAHIAKIQEGQKALAKARDPEEALTTRDMLAIIELRKQLASLEEAETLACKMQEAIDPTATEKLNKLHQLREEIALDTPTEDDIVTFVSRLPSYEYSNFWRSLPADTFDEETWTSITRLLIENTPASHDLNRVLLSLIPRVKLSQRANLLKRHAEKIEGFLLWHDILSSAEKIHPFSKEEKRSIGMSLLTNLQFYYSENWSNDSAELYCGDYSLTRKQLLDGMLALIRKKGPNGLHCLWMMKLKEDEYVPFAIEIVRSTKEIRSFLEGGQLSENAQMKILVALITMDPPPAINIDDFSIKDPKRLATLFRDPRTGPWMLDAYRKNPPYFRQVFSGQEKLLKSSAITAQLRFASEQQTKETLNSLLPTNPGLKRYIPLLAELSDLKTSGLETTTSKLFFSLSTLVRGQEQGSAWTQAVAQRERALIQELSHLTGLSENELDWIKEVTQDEDPKQRADKLLWLGMVLMTQPINQDTLKNADVHKDLKALVNVSPPGLRFSLATKILGSQTIEKGPMREIVSRIADDAWLSAKEKEALLTLILNGESPIPHLEATDKTYPALRERCTQNALAMAAQDPVKAFALMSQLPFPLDDVDKMLIANIALNNHEEVPLKDLNLNPDHLYELFIKRLPSKGSPEWHERLLSLAEKQPDLVASNFDRLDKEDQVLILTLSAHSPQFSSFAINNYEKEDQIKILKARWLAGSSFRPLLSTSSIDSQKLFLAMFQDESIGLEMVMESFERWNRITPSFNADGPLLLSTQMTTQFTSLMQSYDRATTRRNLFEMQPNFSHLIPTLTHLVSINDLTNNPSQEDLTKATENTIQRFAKLYNLEEKDLDWIKNVVADKNPQKQAKKLLWINMVLLAKHPILKGSALQNKELHKRLKQLSDVPHEGLRFSLAIKILETDRAAIGGAERSQVPRLLLLGLGFTQQEAGKLKLPKEINELNRVNELLVKVSNNASLNAKEKKEVLEMALKRENPSKAIDHALLLLFFHKEMLLLQAKNEKELKMALSNPLQKIWNVQDVNAFIKTVGSLTTPLAIYTARLQEFPQATTFLKEFISNLLKNRYLDDRYSLQSPHLATVFAGRDALLASWRQGGTLKTTAKEGAMRATADRRLPFTPQEAIAHLFQKRLIEDKIYPKNPFTHLKVCLENPEKLKTQQALVEKELQTAIAKKDRDAIFYLTQEKFCLAALDPETPPDTLSALLKNLPSKFPKDHPFRKDLENLHTDLFPPAEPLARSTWTVRDTDEWQKIFLLGSSVTGSCVHYAGEGYNNQCLLNYLTDGKTRAIVVEDREGNIHARAVFQILWDPEANTPVLFLQRMYQRNPKPEFQELIKQMAIQRAKELSLPLVAASRKYGSMSGWGDGAPSNPLHSLSSRALEYVDALSVKTDQPWQVDTYATLFTPSATSK